MRKVIYLDTLIILNTFVTFIILLTVRAFARVRTKSVRLIAAAVLGGLSSLLLLVPEMSVFPTMLFRILLGAVLSLVAFYVGDAKTYFRSLGLFYLMTFAGGGVLFFLSQLLRGFLTYQNGFVYASLEFWEIVAGIAGSYLIFTVIRRKCGIGKEKFCYDIELTHGGITARGKALLDSGHFVTDCYNGRPVVIAGEPLLCRLLSEQALKELKAFGNLTASNSKDAIHARCIPVSTVSGCRLLPAFTCSKITVRNDDIYLCVKDISLAMASGLSELSECDALINEKLFESR